MKYLIPSNPIGKHFFLQLENHPGTLKPQKKTELCRWRGCLSTIESPAPERSYHKISELKKHKAENSRKNPKRRKVTAAYCSAHCAMNRHLKVPFETSIGQNEVWNAALKGLSWQEELTGHTKSGQLISGASKNSLCEFFTENLTMKGPESSGLCLRLRTELEQLKVSLENERVFTKSLRTLGKSGRQVSLKDLNQLLFLASASKLEVLRTLLAESKVCARGSSRPSSAKNSQLKPNTVEQRACTQKLLVSPYQAGNAKVNLAGKKSTLATRVTLKFARTSSINVMDKAQH